MRTFEFTDGKSNKFWNIELEGSNFTVTFGKIGTSGQTQTKEFADDAKAKAAHDKLVAEKLAKGYVETTGKQPATPTGPAPLQLALEKALADNSDDLAAHSAYADYLNEQGDPRGEFIQVQLALEGPKCLPAQRKQLQEREKVLLSQHRPQWLGHLADPILKMTDCEYQFARGWLDRLHIPILSLPFAQLLAKAPEARLLRQLGIENTPYDEVDDEAMEGAGPLLALAQSANLANVRIFRLGQLSNPEDVPSLGTHGLTFIFDGVTLVKKMPHLEELYLGEHGLNVEDLFALKSLKRLRVLQVDHIESVYPLEILAANSSFAQLTDLLICPHGGGGYLPLAQVRELVRSPHLKSLKHLQLRLSDMGDAGCQEIVQSGILKRLKVLDIAEGCITDKGAQILAGCPDLKNLQRLDVRSNWLTAAGIKALDAKVAKVAHGGAATPPSDTAHYERGVAHLRRAEYVPAVAAFTEAIGLDPDAANSYVGRALAYRSLGDEAAAIRDEQSARALGRSRGSRGSGLQPGSQFSPGDEESMYGGDME
jgi:uncharacterized protein (TIGR02996 family)